MKAISLPGSFSLCKTTRQKALVAHSRLVALCVEILACLYSSLILCSGAFSRLSFYHLNPKKLSDRQVKHAPILLLHGDFHNASGWLKLARRIHQTSAYKGPIYTLNLNYRTKSENIYPKIYAKIRAIKAQYREKGEGRFRLRMGGHSAGAIAAAHIAYVVSDEEKKKAKIEDVTIEKVVSIAGRLSTDTPKKDKLHGFVRRVEEAIKKKRPANLFVVAAERDYLVPTKKCLVARPENQKIVRNRAHLGILYSKQAERLAIQWLTR